ncbi:hypothetical protein HYX06_05395 [Candidatus Woesearchaeota archaeon]|nr:hypothetical protein [Candidatus Woesearchaeota archaeon]
MEEKKEGHHHIHSTHHINKKNKLDILLIVAAVLGVILIINIFLAFGINQNLKKNIEAAKEAARPAKIQLTLIKNSKCADCFDASVLVDYVKSQKIELLNEKAIEFNSNEAKELISKYKIEKIPSILITGELEKLNLDGFDKIQDALVLSQINPPYTDAASGKVKGRVSLKLVKDESCVKCDNMEALIGQINLAGIKLGENKNISASSQEGKALIAKYKIGFVPTIVLSEDAGEYAIIQQAWPSIGTKEKDAYVLRTVYPPFINLTTGQLRGLIDIIYLTDNSCADCYNVSFHKSVLTSQQSFAMAIGNEKTADISSAEGEDLVSKYSITQVPTVILSSEAGVYPSSTGLAQFFSIEKDNSYVFRQPSVVGAYKDLTTNSIVKPQQEVQ